MGRGPPRWQAAAGRHPCFLWLTGSYRDEGVRAPKGWGGERMRQMEPRKGPHAPGRESRCSPFILLELGGKHRGRRERRWELRQILHHEEASSVQASNTHSISTCLTLQLCCLLTTNPHNLSERGANTASLCGHHCHKNQSTATMGGWCHLYSYKLGPLFMTNDWNKNWPQRSPGPLNPLTLSLLVCYLQIALTFSRLWIKEGYRLFALCHQF